MNSNASTYVAVERCPIRTGAVRLTTGRLSNSLKSKWIAVCRVWNRMIDARQYNKSTEHSPGFVGRRLRCKTYLSVSGRVPFRATEALRMCAIMSPYPVVWKRVQFKFPIQGNNYVTFRQISRPLIVVGRFLSRRAAASMLLRLSTDLEIAPVLDAYCDVFIPPNVKRSTHSRSERTPCFHRRRFNQTHLFTWCGSERPGRAGRATLACTCYLLTSMNCLHAKEYKCLCDAIHLRNISLYHSEYARELFCMRI